MKSLFYEQWYKSRVNKIINIFGESWFQNKQILELGCAHGDIGIEFLKLGADVVFTDERIEFLEDIDKNLKNLYNYSAEFALIDHDKDYSFNKKFDLIIHMGLLYHLQNWRNDIKNALKHSNIIILESTVTVNIEENNNILNLNDSDIKYGYSTKKNTRTYLTQEEVEKELINNGCKFLRLDDEKLNIENKFVNNKKISFIYDWTYERYNCGYYNIDKENVWFKRLWLVLK
jgi:2-polyprenyl-3-methyl-5-hydroxy-6-metoxy-1,4-benzoquinol methylase